MNKIAFSRIKKGFSWLAVFLFLGVFSVVSAENCVIGDTEWKAECEISTNGSWDKNTHRIALQGQQIGTYTKTCNGNLEEMTTSRPCEPDSAFWEDSIPPTCESVIIPSDWASKAFVYVKQDSCTDTGGNKVSGCDWESPVSQTIEIHGGNKEAQIYDYAGNLGTCEPPGTTAKIDFLPPLWSSSNPVEIKSVGTMFGDESEYQTLSDGDAVVNMVTDDAFEIVLHVSDQVEQDVYGKVSGKSGVSWKLTRLDIFDPGFEQISGALYTLNEMNGVEVTAWLGEGDVTDSPTETPTKIMIKITDEASFFQKSGEYIMHVKLFDRASNVNNEQYALPFRILAGPPNPNQSELNILGYFTENVFESTTELSFVEANHCLTGDEEPGLYADNQDYCSAELVLRDGAGNLIGAEKGDLGQVGEVGDGTVSVSDDDRSKVIGSGTRFLSDFQVGDYIVIDGEIRQITRIESNTVLYVDKPFSKSFSDTSYSKPYLGDAFHRTEIVSGSFSLESGDNLVFMGTVQGGVFSGIYKGKNKDGNIVSGYLTASVSGDALTDFNVDGIERSDVNGKITARVATDDNTDGFITGDITLYEVNVDGQFLAKLEGDQFSGVYIGENNLGEFVSGSVEGNYINDYVSIHQYENFASGGTLTRGASGQAQIEAQVDIEPGSSIKTGVIEGMNSFFIGGEKEGDFSGLFVGTNSENDFVAGNLQGTIEDDVLSVDSIIFGTSQDLIGQAIEIISVRDNGDGTYSYIGRLPDGTLISGISSVPLSVGERFIIDSVQNDNGMVTVTAKSYDGSKSISGTVISSDDNQNEIGVVDVGDTINVNDVKKSGGVTIVTGETSSGETVTVTITSGSVTAGDKITVTESEVVNGITVIEGSTSSGTITGTVTEGNTTTPIVSKNDTIKVDSVTESGGVTIVTGETSSGETVTVTITSGSVTAGETITVTESEVVNGITVISGITTGGSTITGTVSESIISSLTGKSILLTQVSIDGDVVSYVGIVDGKYVTGTLHVSDYTGNLSDLFYPGATLPISSAITSNGGYFISGSDASLYSYTGTLAFTDTQGVTISDSITGTVTDKTGSTKEQIFQTVEGVTINSNGTVVMASEGSTTQFLSEFEIGDFIVANGQIRTVMGVVNDEKLIIDEPFEPDLSDFTYSILRSSNYCGDGIVAGDEECDDGNDIDNDSCTLLCENPEESKCDIEIIDGDTYEVCRTDDEVIESTKTVHCNGSVFDPEICFRDKETACAKSENKPGCIESCTTACQNSPDPANCGCFIFSQ